MNYELPMFTQDGKKVGAVTLTEEELSARGLTKNSVFSAIPETRDGKFVGWIPIQLDHFLSNRNRNPEPLQTRII